MSVFIGKKSSKKHLSFFEINDFSIPSNLMKKMQGKQQPQQQLSYIKKIDRSWIIYVVKTLKKCV
jgi:hypothetical protein